VTYVFKKLSSLPIVVNRFCKKIFYALQTYGKVITMAERTT